MKNINAQALGKLGGKKSVTSRFAGKSKKEISEIMRKVRMAHETKKDKKNLVKWLKDAEQIT